MKTPLQPPSRLLLFISISATSATVAAAPPADTNTTALLAPIVISGERPSLTNDRDELARARLLETPGATAVIGTSERRGKANLSLADAVGATPGVITQTFFGGNDQPRITIRGSGQQQNPTQRGVLLLQDGLPLSRADGSYIAASLEPNVSSTIEVYRGASGLRMGSAALGGAINFISLTGRDAQDGRIAVEGGSFATRSARVAFGQRFGDLDLRATLTHGTRDGFRRYNGSERTALLLNAGYRISEALETRIYVDYVDLGFEIPGPVTKSVLKHAPRSTHAGPVVKPNPGHRPPFRVSQPGPNVERDRPRRDAEKIRLSARATYREHRDEFDAGITAVATDETFRFPIPGGIRATDGEDLALDLQYTRYASGEAVVPLLELGAHFIAGRHDRTYHHNNHGRTGAQFATHRLEASTLTLNALATLPLGERWRLSGGLNLIHATRDNDDRYRLPTRPTLRVGGPPPGPLPKAVPARDSSFERDYTELSPQLSLSYAWRPRNLAYLTLARSYEPPTFEDLLTPTGGTPNSGPLRLNTPDLDAQLGDTLEIGVRGDAGRWSWDAVAYHTWLRDELVQLVDTSGVPLGTANAERTRRYGLELGLAAQLSERLGMRLAYTWQDAHFDDDPAFGDNRLAGTQRHTLDARLTFALNERFTFEPVLSWVPSRVPVDNANTLYRDGYALFGVQARYATPNERLTLFVDARNLFDKTYASSSLSMARANPTQAAFLPGDGRAIYGGVELRF